MKAFLRRLKDALRGWMFFYSRERNGQIQAVLGLVTVAAGFLFGISLLEWLAVLLCMGLVLGLEMVNSALEKLADRLHPERHPEIGKVKDMAAGAVLWAAVISAAIALLVFGPRLMNYIQGAMSMSNP
jgi:diacylglycerol kinase